MTRLLVTYYSRTGNTEKMAQLVAEGAAEVEGADCDLRPIAQVSPDDLLNYECIVMGSPTYYGNMAAELKQLLDASVAHHGELEGKVGAAFTSAGGHGSGAETTVLAILEALLIHGMIIQGSAEGAHYGAVSAGSPDEAAADHCRRLGRRAAELSVRLFG